MRQSPTNPMKAIAEMLHHGMVASVTRTGDIVYKPIHWDKVAPKEPDDVLVQRQLQCWLDPGWCMTAPERSESKVNRKRKLSLWWIAGVLSLLGLVTSYPMGGLLAIALVLVIVVALVRANTGATIFPRRGGEIPPELQSKLPCKVNGPVDARRRKHRSSESTRACFFVVRIHNL